MNPMSSVRRRLLALRSGLLVSGIVIALTGCPDPQPSLYPSQQVYTEDTSVGPNDLLEVRVFKQDDMSGEFAVTADGKLSFPQIGEIAAEGKSPTEIANLIRDKLSDGFLRNPQVSVRVKEYHSKKISVFGEVRKGSVIMFTEGMTINEAISQAGGFGPRAWENAVKVTRTSDGKSSEYTVPVKDIASGSAKVFYMRPGDSVYVPKSLN